MIEIQKLLNRIQWDGEFGRGDFEIGVYDRVKDTVDRIPFEKLLIEKGNHFSFSIPNAEGDWVNIPFHRVRNVYKNGECIWER